MFKTTLTAITLSAAMTLSLAAPAMAEPVMTDAQRAEAIDQLSWSGDGTYELPLSHSTLSLPQADARRAYQLFGNLEVFLKAEPFQCFTL